MAVCSSFNFSEALTRIPIDQKLIDSGWEADSIYLIYIKAARPFGLLQYPTS